MIGERFNFEDCFFRDLTICVLDTLEGEIKWTNRFSSGDRIVNVPFYYSMTGDERFLLDSFHDDVVSNSRYVDLNTDIVPRGHLTLTGYEIRSDEFANPNVWLKMVVENDEETRSILTKVRAIPITAKYDLTIHLSSEVDTFKCSQSIMDTLWLYRYMYFEHNFMNIDAIMTIPDTNSIEINREKNLTSDNTIKLTVQFDVQTYYPSFRKPKFPKPVTVTFNTGYINRNFTFKVNVKNSNQNNLLTEFHNSTSSSDGEVILSLGKGQNVGGNLSLLGKDSNLQYSVQIDENLDNNFYTIPNPTPVVLSSQYFETINIFQVTVYGKSIDDPNSSQVLLYSEIHNIQAFYIEKLTNIDISVYIGNGEPVNGNYFQITSKYVDLQYDVDVLVNDNFINVISSENLPILYESELNFSIEGTTLNDVLSNAYTQVGPAFENSDVILFPKMTRWYSNLRNLNTPKPIISDMDTGSKKATL